MGRWRFAVAGCLFAVRPCNSPAGGVRATAISSGHRVRRCGHFGLTCRRTPAYNALCGTLTPQVIFTKPESLAIAMLPPWASVCPLIETLPTSGGLKPCCSGREHKDARCKHPSDLIKGHTGATRANNDKIDKSTSKHQSIHTKRSGKELSHNQQDKQCNSTCFDGDMND